MRSFRQIFSLVVLFIISQKTYSQAVPVYAADSLAGFNESQVAQQALSEGVFGNAYNNLLNLRKRLFIINKYNFTNPYLGETPVDPSSLSPSTTFKPIGNPNILFSAPCVNEGFELGNMTGWTVTRGVNVNSCVYPSTFSGVSFPSASLAIVSPPFTDPIIGPISASPFAGNNVVRINDAVATGNLDVVRLSQTFPVTSTNFLYEFAYQAVMATQHNCCEQTYMQVLVKNFQGTPLACPLFTFAPPPPTGPTCSSPGITWATTIQPSSGFTVAFNPTWQKYSIDLTNFINQNVTIEVSVADCSQGAHWGYVYFDSNCNELAFNLNGTTTVPAPTQTVDLSGLCGQSATITAPGGLGPYTWTGPSGSSSSQTLITSISGSYTVAMNPPGSCVPITRIVNLSFPPPTTVTASPANLCGSGTNTSSILSAIGATSYTWMPGGANTSTISVTPASTTIYTVTAKTGTCVGNYTVQVSVNPDPSLFVLSSIGSGSLCPGQSATLIATGANSYAWNPGALTGSNVVVSPTITTTYTTVGTSTAGCTSSVTTQVNVSQGLTVTIAAFSPTYNCAGTGVTMVAGGATSLLWLPDNVSGFVQTFSPTATTIYTVIGSAGSCTNSATKTISVNTGPSMTVTASPASICPGSSSTLSALAPSATGFTWSPVASNASFVVVSPTIATVYSVTGVDAMGCPSTYTVSPAIIPIPAINISPASPTICAGGSQALTATGGVSYTWNPGNMTGNSVVVSPATNTTYTVVGSNGTCTNSANVTVTVVALPTVGASPSSPTVCLGSPVTLTGTGATSYTWNPGNLNGTNVIVTPVATTNYTVTGSNGACTNSAVTSVTVLTGPTINTLATPTAVCPGGSATLSATGAVAYTWTPGGFNTPSIVVNPVATTLFSVTGASAAGCLTNTVINIVVNPAPNVSVTASPGSVCIGNSTTLTASGAVSYVWNPGNLSGTSVVASPVINTTYTVIGTSAQSCTNQATIQVTVVPLPTVGATSSPTAICPGNSATLTGTGATSYTWNPGNLTGTSVIVSPTITTIYTVVGNNSGCTASSQVTVVVNSNPAIGVLALPTNICPGGTSTLTASGGVSYVWSNGATTFSTSVSPLTTTAFTVTGTNAQGCSTIRTVTVTVNPAPSITVTATSPSLCAGGSVTLSASGAASFSWNPGALTGANVVVSPTLTTTYTVSGQSVFGCVGQNTILITVVPIPVVSAASNPTAICIGGTAALTGLGATNYTWNPGNLTGASVNVSPTLTTIYTVLGNTGGCSATSQVTVVVNSGPVFTVSASPATICAGSSSTLSAVGALNYTWNPGNLTGSSVVVTPSLTTVYTVIGDNAGGCTSTRTVMVTVNPAPTVGASSSSPSICAGSNATLTGTGANTYTWNPGNLTGSSVIVSPVSLTSYTLIGTAAGGCTNSAIVDVGVIPLPIVSASSLPASICNGGSATLSGFGATNYTWNPGNLTGNSVIVSPAVTTIFTVIGESNGCTATSQVTVDVNSNPSLTLTASPATICAGNSSTLTASGAANYTWTPGNLNGSSVVVSPAVTTIYNVTGSNGAGCTITQTLEVVVTGPPTVNITTPSDTICIGGNTTLNASGATSFIWNPGNLSGASIIVSPTSDTNYTVTGTNGAGCSGDASILITVLPIPVVGATSSPTSICQGSSATLTGFGANTYTWNPGNLTGASVNVSPASTTLYNVIGDNGGCTATAQVIVIVNPVPTLTVSASPPFICPGNSSTLSASGAVNYTWNPGNLNGSSVIVSPSLTTVYLVTGENSFGCTSSQTVQVTVAPAPAVVASASSNTICEGASTNLSASGATSYSWMPGNLTGQNVTVSPLTTTNYTVTGTTGAGCSGLDVITIVVIPAPTVTATASPASICSGNTSTLTASGATSYTWLPMNLTGTSVTVAPTANTTYTLIGDNGGICTDLTVVTVTVNSVPVVNINATSTSICTGNSATLSASGTLGYVWQNTGETTPDIVVSPGVTTVYTVTGSNGAGCSASATFTLNVGAASNISLTATPPVICQGFTTTILATGGTSYTWAAGVGFGSTVLSNPMTTTTYTVFSDNGVCTSSAAITVTVIPAPIVTASVSPSTVCSGNSVTLTAGGATSYTWLPGMQQPNAILVDTPPASMNYTVTGTSGAGCPGTAIVSVTVLSTPTVVLTSNPPALCIGGTATLTASGATAYTLEPGTLTGTSFTVNPTANTTYTLFGDNGGCANGLATLELTVNPLPVVTATSSALVICGGSTVELTASGAQNYSWTPNNAIGTTVIDTPLVPTTYTVTGQDVNGCISDGTISINVTPQPTLLISPTSTLLCQGDAVTLTASGAVNYTWDPGTVINAVITDTPTITTTYTVQGQDAIGCVGSETIVITVVNTPTINVTPIHTPVCEGSPVTFTATGATNYTWLPSGVTTDTNTEVPFVTSNYTVIGDNGGGCVSTFTFDVIVNPLPTGLIATASGSISCATPTVDLFGSSTSTNVSYSWTGPQSFTSAAQNPTAVNVWGVFTLSVSDNTTGCVATTTVEVITDGSIPLVTATTSGSITCAVSTVTLNAVHTTTNPAYLWTGPNGFTSIAQSFTTAIAGIYSVTVTDLTSTCKDFDGITVGTHTRVTITSSISAATCSNSSGNNDGTIQLFNFGPLDKFDLVSGSTYTGAATYTNANIISTDGIITTNLANPTSSLAFTIRLFDAEGCTKDTTLILQPTDCVPRTLGLAKEVSTVTPNTDGTYNITYTVVAKNYDTNPLTNISLIENLSATFPLPTTFTVSTPVIATSVSSVVLNTGFDGSAQLNLIDALTSTLVAGDSAYITFNVTVKTNGVFGPFNNWIIGDAVNGAGVAVRDSSTRGLHPSFPNGGNPNNNSLPTIINFTPQSFFGITKTGAVSARLSDNTYDISYNVTVHNLGNDTLYNVVVKDSLFQNTIRNPASYTIKTGPVSDGNLLANASFNGNSDVNLAAPFSKMPPGAVNSINFVINVNLDTITVIKNSAFGNCFTLNNVVLSDTSNAGTNPDSDNNHIWNEPSDNIPTVLTITNHTLFIPQGFSPDGDAINQFFVIQGLPTTGDNNFTVFNRWGNKVYYKGNYDNTWEGYPNVNGTIGGNKLPQGTYYYILDMKGSGMKPITGFIVLQY